LLAGAVAVTAPLPAQTPPELQTVMSRAAEGDMESQYAMGNAYANGTAGVTRDYTEALKWYRRAADKGFAPAQFSCGLAYELGRGVPADAQQAFKYYLLAAEQGYASAQFNVGNMYSAGRGVGQDFFEANLWFRQAADNGVVEAQFNLGVAYEAGNGVKKDEAQAARWYKQAAERGYSRAQYNLGLLYDDGRGVAKDAVKAAALYRTAADQGYAPAQVNYGLMLSEGRPRVPADPVQAYVWLSRAVQNGASAEARDALTRTLTPDQVTAAKGLLGGGSAPAHAPAPTGAIEASAPVSPANDGGKNLVEQLREQSRRLAVQVESLTADKEAAERRISTLVSQLKELQQDKASPAGVQPAKGEAKADTAESATPSVVVANLQRDNVRLNDEVKRATRELLSLHNQIRSLRSQAGKSGGGESGDQPPKVAAEMQQMQERAVRLEEENRRLVERLAQLDQAPKPAAEEGVSQLQQQMSTLLKEKADLEQWARSLEKTLNEKTSAAASLEATVAELQKRLATTQGDSTNIAALRDALVQANARVADLQRDLAVAREPQGEAADELKSQLAQANQALEKSGAAVAALTQTNEKLARELKAAEALRTRNEQLARDNEQLTAFMNGNRSDLEKAQGRVQELEKQLTDALTVRTRGQDESKPRDEELDEANRSIEKLTTAVAELTAANEKLERDLDNAQKSTAAALAAQSQAVSAANPDAFQMEISTLNSRIKQLEAQVEEERSGAAREVATLAGQLQRTRETNKSLSDANRALLSAKENDTSAARDDIAQLEGRVRELTAANEELRRIGQKQASDLRSLTAERESLQSQLVDARKVATVLPGLADEKAALQERLEAVGSQLVQLQQEHEELQKTSADLSTQLTASRQAAEKAQSELTAVQTRTAEAEKAAEAHNASVAELTQANTRLETEREDMRRLLESYRGDIARLTQTVRAAEQQKTDAQRSSQQNIDAVTAQMAQLRRDLDAARANQARLADAHAAQERERAATITQLRTENGALTVRLNQAQGTLDQIAAAARLGTPAATIASGGAPSARPAPAQAAEARYHTVGEGDSLSRISMRYYGTPNRWQEIFQANRDVLQGSSALRIGMQLRIP
jgi:TPR repeat protein/chromosome segregation ATPase